jgi:hypothetical protein
VPEQGAFGQDANLFPAWLIRLYEASKRRRNQIGGTVEQHRRGFSYDTRIAP